MVLPVWPICRSEVTQPFCTSGREQPYSVAEQRRELAHQLKFRAIRAQVRLRYHDVGKAQIRLGGFAVRQERQHLVTMSSDQAERMGNDPPHITLHALRHLITAGAPLPLRPIIEVIDRAH